MIFARPSNRIAATLLLLLWLGCAPLQAQEEERDPFIVERAAFKLDKSLLLLDLVIDSELPGYIVVAIDQGFAVPFMFEVEFRARQKYWFDERLISLKQQYLLHYQPMLNSFVVVDVNNSERRYFTGRQLAVRYMEVVYNYPMLDIENLASDRDFYARVRFGIDADELPLPLQSNSPWADDWDLQSDWFELQVKRPGS